MRKLVAAAGVAATTAFLAFVFWQSAMNATDAAGTRTKPHYSVAGAPYLPVQNLEPAY